MFRNYTLRGINTDLVNSCEELKNAIRNQLKDVICRGDFDVGFVQGGKVVHTQNRLDIQEFWQNFEISNLILWLKSEDNVAQSSSASKKRKLQVSNNEENI